MRKCARVRLGLAIISLLGFLEASTAISARQPAAFLPRITRGPYLQSGTPNSMIVRWRTTQRTSSVVRYGRHPGVLDLQARSPGHFTDHTVLVAGLEPGTRYYYSVGDERQTFQGNEANFFVTAPAADAPQPIRVWVLGDPGTDYPTQRRVRDAYLRRAGNAHTDLILTLGDNAYGKGTDAQYGKAFFHIYRESFKSSAVWPTLGNHDARYADSATESGIYYDVFTLPRMGQSGGVPSSTEAYYSFDYGNTHFICLNSQDADLSPSGRMLSWLKTDLAANHRRWTIAYWHHPPYSKGSHDSDTTEKEDQRMSAMRQVVLPLLESAGTDLVLCGHSHLYERSFLLHGHYGTSDSLAPGMILDRGEERTDALGTFSLFRSNGTQRGTIYVNAGSAGHATPKRQLHGLNHPIMAAGLNIPGSLFLDISKAELSGCFLDEGGVPRDRFVLQKGEASALP